VDLNCSQADLSFSQAELSSHNKSSATTNVSDGTQSQVAIKRKAEIGNFSLRPLPPRNQNDTQNDRNDTFSKHPPMGVLKWTVLYRTPPWGGKTHNLGDLEIEECKLELRNANTPLCGRGGARKLGTKSNAEENWTGKMQVHPPFLLGGGAWNFFAGSI